MSNNKEMSEEDYLKKHISELENKVIPQSDIPFVNEPRLDTRTTDLQFFSFDIKMLPCGDFYPNGTTLMVRAAQVREIQAYSMVDDNNFYDIVEKMNDILQSCVRIKYSDGKVSSYLELKDQDRLYLVFLIRELTFQEGNSLTVNTKCSCKNDVQMELKRSHFVFHEISPKLNKFLTSNKTYHFSLVNGKEYDLSPPNIGLQKAFTDYIIKESNEKRTPNMSFLKIIPFMLPSRTTISYEGIKSKLEEFESMDDISFQFLNDAVSKMSFGIKELKKTCSSCGDEVRTEMQFPNGASGIFVVHDAFEAYIKE